jgi:hypothetical protein
LPELIQSRLRAQRLIGSGLGGVVEAVRHFGAVQSQDYPAAKWALGLRVKGLTEADVDRAYDAGAIVRTHVLRPTWHFVAPEDLRWMLALTGPKIEQGMASRYRNLELDAPTITRALGVFEKAMAGGRHLTRAEAGILLAANGIAPDGQRLPHLLSTGELRGLLTSGPRKGRQPSYTLLEERVPKARRLDRDEAVAELTLRYFVSHGPAQLRDFVWWSGLTQAEASRGLVQAGDALQRTVIEGRDYWSDARLRLPRIASPAGHLLPNFDEYTVGYTDRSAILHPERPFRPQVFAFSSVLSNVVVVDGRLHGSWRRVAAPKGLVLEVQGLTVTTPTEREIVTAAAGRFSTFLGRPVEVAWR